MKKEFGKWFLDLAKYILTAIALTTLFNGMEESKLLWTTFAAFSICLLFGYLLLRQSDMEQTQTKVPTIAKATSELKENQTTDILSIDSSSKKNKKKKKK